jgi:hypothetical protein
MLIEIINVIVIHHFKNKLLKKSKFILSFLFIGIYSVSFAQNVVTFDDQIAELNILGKQILTNESDEAKYQANAKYKATLKTAIETQASFDYDFSKLKTISVLKANNLRIYNWALPLTDGSYEYFAFFQIKTGKDEYRVVELEDKSESIKSPEARVLTNKNWYGALYYKIIYSKDLGKDTYTLLGWDGNNLLTNKKLIDVVTTSTNGIIKFGAPIFKTEKKTKKRVIFEYAENVVMSLKYHANIKKIVFDVLVPSSSDLTGVYEYYGPTLETFDAFFIEKKKWNYQKDIDIKLDPNLKDNFWTNPKEK